MDDRVQRSAIRLAEFQSLDTSSDVPLYAQLAEILSKRIISARARLVGELLPSEEEIAAHFGISRPTVRQAMSRMQIAGLITRVRGKGTTVTPPRVERDIGRAFDVLPANHKLTFKLIERSLVTPTPQVATALNLQEGERVERIRRYRYHASEIIGFEERFIPAQLSKKVTAAQLNKEAGIVFARRLINGVNGTVRFTVRAIPATASIAKLLGIRKGEPVLSSEHTYLKPDETPVLFGTVLFRGDRYDFSFQAPINGA